MGVNPGVLPLFRHALVDVDKFRAMVQDEANWNHIKPLLSYEEALKASLPEPADPEVAKQAIKFTRPESIRIYDSVIREINEHIERGVTTKTQAETILFDLATLSAVILLRGQC